MLVCTPAIKAVIREGKMHQIYSLMQAGQKYGMQTMNQALLPGGRSTRHISPEEAMERSRDRAELEAMLGKVGVRVARLTTRRNRRCRSIVWKGRTLGGEIQAGEIDGRDARTRRWTLLRKKRIIVTSVREKPKGCSFAMPKLGGRPRQRRKDLAIFTRQFATMINAGLPLVQCLDILAKQTSKPSLRRAIIAEVMRDVEAGSTLADALGKHQKVFDDLFRQHGRGRRGGRCAGRDPDASRDLHREGRRAASARSRAR